MQSFITPSEIYYGENSTKQLKNIIEQTKCSKALLVTDPIVLELGLLEEIINILRVENVNFEIYDQVEPEPSIAVAQALIDQIRQGYYDILIGVGGGSALDMAKAAAVLANNEGEITDYLNLTATKKIMNRGIPKILIPTTAGTGAEVTDIAVFSKEDTKDVITHNYLIAEYVIVDPKFTHSLPMKVTAASGVDAFTHAIEAYTSVNASIFSDTFALNALKRINKYLRPAVWNGNDIKARGELSTGSLEAGISFYNAGVAGVHALAYPLGGKFKIPHGESNAVLLPYVYANIWPSCISRLNDVARAIGLNTEFKSEREIAQEVVMSLFYFIQDVGLPSNLQNYNITEDDIETLTRNALLQTRLLSRSPKVLTEKEIRSIYTNALNGTIDLD